MTAEHEAKAKCTQHYNACPIRSEEQSRLRNLVMAFGAGGFSLAAAEALYQEGQRLLDEELAELARGAPTARREEE